MRRLFAVVVFAAAAIACSGQRAEEANARGVELDQAGKYADAAHAFGKAVSLQPSVAKYHYNLGLVYARMNHFDEAEQQFRETLRIEPGHVNASRALSITVSSIQSRGRPY